MRTRFFALLREKTASGSSLVSLSYIFLAIMAVAGLIFIIAADPSGTCTVQEFSGSGFVTIPQAGVAGGVLAGVAYYFAWPLWLVRAGFIVAVMTLDKLGDMLVIAYLVTWILAPEIGFVPADFTAVTGGTAPC